jgi:hypothetical protein
MLTEGVGISVGIAFELLLGRSLSYLTYYVGREDINAQARMILNDKMPAMEMVLGDALEYEERNLWDRIIFTSNALSEEALQRFSTDERLVIGLALYGPYLELDTILSLVWAGGWRAVIGLVGTQLALSFDSPAWDEFQRIAGVKGWGDTLGHNYRLVNIQEQILIEKLSEADSSLATVMSSVALKSARGGADVLFSSVSDLAAGLLPWVSPEDLNPSRPDYDQGDETGGNNMKWEDVGFEFPDVDYSYPGGPPPAVQAGMVDVEGLTETIGKAVDFAAPLINPYMGLVAGTVSGVTGGDVTPGKAVTEGAAKILDIPYPDDQDGFAPEAPEAYSVQYVEDHDEELADQTFAIESYGRGRLYQVKSGDNFARVVRSVYGQYSKKLGLIVADHPLNQYIKKTDKYGFLNMLGKRGPLFTPKYSGFGTEYRSGSEQPMLWLPEV